MGHYNQDMILRVESLNTFYGKAQILFDVSLDVDCGEVVVLFGRNGAGKTTTLKSIMGLVASIYGKILFKGKPIDGLPPYKCCNHGLGYVPQNRRIFKRLTVLENLEAGRQPPKKGFAAWTPDRLFGLFPNLAERRNQLAGKLSGGEQQMLTISRTLMGNPELIILDEPTEGLAPIIVNQLSATIQRLKSEGISILMAEQNLNFARANCDRAYILYQGHIQYQSPIAGFSQEAYERYCAL
jgi:branched-chain amino acid transport system ATP-binding protein